MLKKITLHILAFTIASMMVIFLIGQLLIGPAPSATGVLSADFPVEPVQISAVDGSTVYGWLTYGEPNRGVVLLVHSMRSNRLEMLSRARFLRNQGYSVLSIDLYAHGETPGDRITLGLRESDSVVASVDFLRRTFPHERLAAIGVSLGAAAIVLAKRDLRLNAVILESLHPTLEEAVNNRLKLHFGDYGSILLPLVLWPLSFYIDSPLDELNPIDRINDLNTPVLFISGTLDAHTTQPETERLWAAARTPKELWIIPDAGHYNMHHYAGKAYEQRINAFLAQYLQSH